MKNISLPFTTLVISLASVNNSSVQSNALYSSSLEVMNSNTGKELNTEAVKHAALTLSTFRNTFQRA